MKGRASMAQEIFDALRRGGFEFPETWKEEHLLKNVAISLSKNRNDFILIPTNEGKAFGLWEFYPEKKKVKEKGKKGENKQIEETTKEEQLEDDLNIEIPDKEKGEDSEPENNENDDLPF